MLFEMKRKFFVTLLCYIVIAHQQQVKRTQIIMGSLDLTENKIRSGGLASNNQLQYYSFLHFGHKF